MMQMLRVGEDARETSPHCAEAGTHRYKHKQDLYHFAVHWVLGCKNIGQVGEEEGEGQG